MRHKVRNTRKKLSQREQTNSRNSRTTTGMPYCPFSDKEERGKKLCHGYSGTLLYDEKLLDHINTESHRQTDMNGSKGQLCPIVI